MSTQLKHLLNAEVVRFIARDLAAVSPGFDAKAFVRESLVNLDALELMARGWHLAEALKRHLPPSFPEAASRLLEALERTAPLTEPRATTGAKTQSATERAVEPGPTSSFRFLPHSFFVAKYGLDDFEPSMALQHALTQRFTAEFSIRPFLERHPQATLRRLEEWTRDESPHVRRLVSEGTRPRLPWAPRLRAFQQNPAPVLKLLERLKDDPSLYVRRSVANSLNDIGKDHPELLVKVCRTWLKGASDNRRWIVRHALRALLKSCHPGALELLGVGEKPRVRVENLRLSPRSVEIGGELTFSCELVSIAREAQTLLVDYVVHFVKANGEARPKVFKLTRANLAPGQRAPLRGSVTFQQLTTRTHHPGVHLLELQVNGVRFPLGKVRVTHESSRQSRTSKSL